MSGKEYEFPPRTYYVLVGAEMAEHLEPVAKLSEIAKEFGTTTASMHHESLQALGKFAYLLRVRFGIPSDIDNKMAPYNEQKQRQHAELRTAKRRQHD